MSSNPVTSVAGSQPGRSVVSPVVSSVRRKVGRSLTSFANGFQDELVPLKTDDIVLRPVKPSKRPRDGETTGDTVGTAAVNADSAAGLSADSPTSTGWRWTIWVGNVAAFAHPSDVIDCLAAASNGAVKRRPLPPRDAAPSKDTDKESASAFEGFVVPPVNRARASGYAILPLADEASMLAALGVGGKALMRGRPLVVRRCQQGDLKDKEAEAKAAALVAARDPTKAAGVAVLLRQQGIVGMPDALAASTAGVIDELKAAAATVAKNSKLSREFVKRKGAL